MASSESDEASHPTAEHDQDPDEDSSPFSNQFVQDSFQSLARVSLAGLGGSLVGAGLEKRQQQQGHPNTPSHSSSGHKRHRPPSQFRNVPPATVGKMAVITSRANLPATWALSCSFFVLVLETARRTSPTTMLLERIQDSNKDWQLGRYRQAALTATGDYAIGGMAAGLAATVAQKSPLRLGLGMGLTLGLVAGCAQAGINVAELYLLDQQLD